MKKTASKRLLREVKNITILAVIAAVLGYLAYRHISDVARRTAEDVIRTEWIKAAKQVVNDTVPSSVIGEGDADARND